MTTERARFRSLAWILALGVAACGGSPDGSASEGEGTARGEGAAEPVATVYSSTTAADDLGRTLESLGTKMVQLAEAMPEDSYDWAPMDGVRSVGAVFAHVAADNYYVPALFGRPVEGTGVTTTSGIRDYENARGSKAEIVAELQRSFDAMNESLAATRSDFGTEVMLRENSLSTGDLWVRAITHLHEHLGQSIAYARSNGVVPPWSAGG